MDASLTVARARTTRVPALVLGSDITALGVIRCLGRAGILTYCASRDLGLVALSRWCRRTPQRLDRNADLGAYLERLPFERAVLFACSDDWVLAIASLDEALARRFPSSQASRATLEALVDKRRLSEILCRHDVPYPRTIKLQSADDLAALTHEQLAASFLKPCDSQAFSARYRVKAFSIASRGEALARFRQAAEDGFEVVLQESVPGPPTNHYFIDGFVDRKGQICARFARQRLRMHPMRFGNSTLMTTVPLERLGPALANIERLIAALKYRGVFSAEFKYDDRDRTFKLLEMNVRPWWYVEFAALCGVDVCAMAYRDALGEEVHPVDRYEIGARCVHPRIDLITSLRLMRRGELRPGAMLASWKGARQAVFCRDDPLPALGDLAFRAGKWLGGLRIAGERD